MAKSKGKRTKKPWPCQRCGKCCVVMAMPVSLVNTHRDKFQRTVIKERSHEISDNVFVISIITEDMNCVFLTIDNLCAIYDERPMPCRKFGQSSGVLECHRVTMSGRVRSPKESQKAYERISKLEKDIETSEDSIIRGYDVIRD